MKNLFLLWTVLALLLTGCQKNAPLPTPPAEEVYCGNTQTTVLYQEKEYFLLPGDSVTLTDLLRRLEYDPEKVCKCADYDLTVTTEFGGPYHISLEEAYARIVSEEGHLAQAELTAEQLETVKSILKKLK